MSAKLEPILVTGAMAAALLGVSERTFERHVRSELPSVRIGSKRLYARKDIEGWVEKHKVGASEQTHAPACSSFGSVTAGDDLTARRAKRMLAELRSEQPQSSGVSLRVVKDED